MVWASDHEDRAMLRSRECGNEELEPNGERKRLVCLLAAERDELSG